MSTLDWTCKLCGVMAGGPFDQVLAIAAAHQCPASPESEKNREAPPQEED